MLRTLLILMGLLASVAAGAATNEFCAAGVGRFDAAYRAWDASGFAQAAGWFRMAVSNAPVNSINHYWLGVAEFHRMLALEHVVGGETNKASVTAARDSAVEALTDAVRLKPTDAESHALLGTLYGMKIGRNLFRAARLGPRVAKHRKLALRYGATNPRVQYLLGMCRFHTAKKPAEWRAALGSFELAEKLFEQEAAKPAGPLDPRWGHSACLTFLGLTHEKLGERLEAAACFRKALALHPGDHLAREGLKRISLTP